MQEPWCLATNRSDDADTIVRLYARRFDIEHTFRDQKDRRFGFGLYYCTVGTPERRDRLLLVLTFAAILATLLGAAGEQLQLDKQLHANTATKRTHSLFGKAGSTRPEWRGRSRTKCERCSESFGRHIVQLIESMRIYKGMPERSIGTHAGLRDAHPLGTTSVTAKKPSPVRWVKRCREPRW